MAYSAPKWTQMTAPSGTTSVNALTSAGDLFSKAMDAASDGLKSYDKGVESRLQEDSDVNTAALRRRLESATDLDSLNAGIGFKIPNLDNISFSYGINDITNNMKRKQQTLSISYSFTDIFGV